MEIDRLMKFLSEDLKRKKEEIIKTRLAELQIDAAEYVEDMRNRRKRFNPFLVEEHEGFGSLIYYNDGSDNGLFIVGFTGISFEDSFEATTAFLSSDSLAYHLKTHSKQVTK